MPWRRKPSPSSTGADIGPACTTRSGVPRAPRPDEERLPARRRVLPARVHECAVNAAAPRLWKHRPAEQRDARIHVDRAAEADAAPVEEGREVADGPRRRDLLVTVVVDHASPRALLFVELPDVPVDLNGLHVVGPRADSLHVALRCGGWFAAARHAGQRGWVVAPHEAELDQAIGEIARLGPPSDPPLDVAVPAAPALGPRPVR